jgi:hypothetical protein
MGFGVFADGLPGVPPPGVCWGDVAASLAASARAFFATA